LYFEKGKFGGKKFTLQKSEFYFAKEFFPFSSILENSNGHKNSHPKNHLKHQSMTNDYAKIESK
jgi:hypothetical protein